MSKRSAALARIRQLACLHLPGGLFVASLLPILRQLTQSDSAAFFWLDESGAIANVYAEHFPVPLPAAPPDLDAQLIERAAARPAFQAVSVAVLASTIDNETVGDGWYGEILQRNGAHFILHGIARLDGHVLGRLTLFRSARSAAFGLQEIAALSSVMRYVARGLGGSVVPLDPKPFPDGEEVLQEEFVIANRMGDIVEATDTGRRLLLLATGCALAPRAIAVAAGETRRLLLALSAAEGGKVGPHARISKNTIWGRFVLNAYRLNDSQTSDRSHMGVHIRRTQPASLRFVNAMNGLPLSPQQREIALLIARGLSNRDIAAQLSVSVNTVAYHIKQLFYKLRVHDRAGLLARIDAGFALPQEREPAFP